jgi:thymidylate synthase (FAD)
VSPRAPTGLAASGRPALRVVAALERRNRHDWAGSRADRRVVRGSVPPPGRKGTPMEVTVAPGRMTTVQDITFRSDMTVELIKHAASDADVIWAARVSTKGEQTLAEIDADPERSAGLINFLMRDRHGTPFEHSSMTFYVQAPIFVFREFMRHRTFSYNEESGRYRKLNPVFYRPGPARKLVQTGKPGAYVFEPGTPAQHELVSTAIEESCRQAYTAYLSMLEAGVAREVARAVLPVGLYSSMYATCNARALMNFLSLRVQDSGSTFPSFPQREIEMVAEQMEAQWARLMPLTHAAFERNGRVCP